MNRRDFMKISGAAAGLVLIPVCNLQAADALVKLKTDDSQAKALGYVEKTTIAGSVCKGCNNARGDLTAAWVGCSIFPGKEVTAGGWCMAYSKRAAS